MSTIETIRRALTAAVADSEPGAAAATQLCITCEELLEIDGAAVSLILDGTSGGTFGSSSASSRRLEEYQFTFGEGPSLDAAATCESVLVPDLRAAGESRWPAFTEAVLADGIRGVFALPIIVAAASVGALDLFRAAPGPLPPDHLAGAELAARLVRQPLVHVAQLARDDLSREADPDDARDEAEHDSPFELDRIEVYQATGMLISQLDVSAEEALLRLRGHAIATNQTASEVALAIVQRTLVLQRDDPDPTAGRPT